jgi:FAD/FMN-containing dehydrogenase
MCGARPGPTVFLATYCVRRIRERAGGRVERDEWVETMTTPSTIHVAGLEGGPVNLTARQIDTLASHVRGRLLRPGDNGWEDAVRVWNGMVAKVPALVFQPTSARDVAAAVRFARDQVVLLSIKGGGHNIAGTCIAEGGLTLDMSRMREVTVDLENKLAHVGPGCLLKDVDRATQEHGLATVLGFMSEVGVAGLTLGGGLGYLTRRFGWTVDNLQEVEIVTADGAIRTANRVQHADLFWALRGGGGNFGVVTRFTFRLHEVGPTVYGGLIGWPFGRADEILRAYRTIAAEAPRELTVWMILLNAPPMPFVPAEWHGRKICAMVVCYSGDLGKTEEALAPIRALREPVVDVLQEWPYIRQQSFLDDAEPKGAHYYMKTEYVADLSDGLLTAVREAFAECHIPEGQVGFLHLGGAVNQRDEDDGAVGNRDARFALGVIGMWEAGEPNANAFQRWIHDGWARVRPFSTGRTYINFQTADETEERVRATYGANFDRLVKVKEMYDPRNVFRRNRNIRARSANTS